MALLRLSHYYVTTEQLYAKTQRNSASLTTNSNLYCDFLLRKAVFTEFHGVTYNVAVNVNAVNVALLCNEVCYFVALLSLSKEEVSSFKFHHSLYARI